MSLRFFDIKWEDVNEFLKNIGFMTVETFHKWVTIFIKGDYQEFSNDLRGVHDESTFRSGEVSPKRWFFKENTLFFSKGRGRSHMVSDFFVQHGSGPFFGR
ncbi:unnamed protein product, partial [Rotaria sp. Silwood1]